MIDPFKPVRFFDDRSKLDCFMIMHKMVFLDNRVCLCTAYEEGSIPPAIPAAADYYLFVLDGGHVITDHHPFVMIAENYEKDS
jgi:hypothetical protein